MTKQKHLKLITHNLIHKARNLKKNKRKYKVKTNNIKNCKLYPKTKLKFRIKTKSSFSERSVRARD